MKLIAISIRCKTYHKVANKFPLKILNEIFARLKTKYNSHGMKNHC